MSIARPDEKALAAIAEARRFGLSPADVAEYAPIVDAVLGSFDRVEELYAQTAPAPVERTSWTPSAQENPLGAWYVQCEVTGSGEGPLAGRTVAIKDNTQVAGVPMMNGSQTLEGWVPVRDATIVTRLLAAGATITGKAVCEDLCFSGGSHTSRTGAVRNPWDPTRSAGGSSSGSAVLVATGAADMATGGDQGGSIRMPSAYSGIVGHKPTHGLVPYTGAFPIEQTLDHVGPMTRTVADAALMLGVIAGRDGLDPRQPDVVDVPDYVAGLEGPVAGLRVGVLAEGFGIPGISDPAVDEAVRDAIEQLRGLGVVAEEVSIPLHRDGIHLWNVLAGEGAAAQMIDGNAYGLNWQGEYDPELIEYYGRRWRELPHEFSTTVQAVLLATGHTTGTRFGAHYAMGRNLALRLRAAYTDALSRFDVLVMPTVPLRATPLPTAVAGRQEVFDRALEHLGNTAPFDISGNPAITVPVAQADGLPTGLMIVGRHFDDATVLRLAHHYEQAVGGFPIPEVVL
jgi:amidase